MTHTNVDVLKALFEAPQFSIPQPEKERLLTCELQRLTRHHRSQCEPYRRALDAQQPSLASGMAGIPYVPIHAFKRRELVSVRREDVIKTLTSSGTTGQAVSRILLDHDTAARQTQALARIMTHVLGPARRPMIVIDTPGVVKDRRMFSARAAGVLGMMSFGRNHFYALDDEMRLDRIGLQAFLDRHAGSPMLIFGFTFMVWKYFYQQLKGARVDLRDAVLIHSGGWKKLVEESVDARTFRDELGAATGIRRIHNFYGMAEQVGSVFLEADDGYLRPPNFADVIIRDTRSWMPVPDGRVGVVQVLSALPTSYPGHSILTEDLGVVHGVADGPWAGKRLEIIGRIPRSELRGCSDTHAAEVSEQSV